MHIGKRKCEKQALMEYVLTERVLRRSLRLVNVLRGVKDYEGFGHYFVDVAVDMNVVKV